MNESTYIFVAVLFAMFLSTVIMSNLVANLVAGVINYRATRKARRL